MKQVTRGIIVLGCVFLTHPSCPVLGDGGTTKTSSPKGETLPSSSEVRIQFTKKTIEDLAASIEETGARLDAYDKLLDDKTKANGPVTKALETLRDIQHLRSHGMVILKKKPSATQKDIDTLHSGDDVNGAIRDLPEDSSALKDAKNTLIQALKDFKNNLDKATLTRVSQKNKSPKERDQKEKQNAATGKKEKDKESLKTDQDSDTSVPTDKKINKPSPSDLLKTHKDIAQQANTIGKHIEELRELLRNKGDDTTTDHRHALEFLEESHEKRQQLIQQAENDGRPLNREETEKLHEDTNGLHVALGLIPNETPEETALRDNIINDHSDLLEKADAHMDTHMGDVMKPSS